MLQELTSWAPDPLVVVLFQAGLSLCTFMVYGLDKRAAKTGGWRVSERALHLLAAAGGWPGAFVGQQVFRHKTVKPSFRRVFWVTLLPPALLLGWALSSGGIAF